MRKTLIAAAVAALFGLLTAAEAHAYGAVSRTATYTNPYTGRTGAVHETTAVGPNGNVYREGNVEGAGAYGRTYETGGARVYSPTTYSNYSAAGAVGSGNVAVTRSTTYP